MMKTKMELEEFIDYAERFNGMKYHSLEQVKVAEEKLLNIMKRYGFEYYRSFSSLNGSFGKKKDTTFFHQLELEGGKMYTIQIGYLENFKGNGSRKKLTGYEGVFRVSYRGEEDLNPDTGKPWQIGDIKYVNANYSLMLTKHGWHSGD